MPARRAAAAAHSAHKHGGDAHAHGGDPHDPHGHGHGGHDPHGHHDAHGHPGHGPHGREHTAGSGAGSSGSHGTHEKLPHGHEKGAAVSPAPDASKPQLAHKPGKIAAPADATGPIMTSKVVASKIVAPPRGPGDGQGAPAPGARRFPPPPRDASPAKAAQAKPITMDEDFATLRSADQIDEPAGGGVLLDSGGGMGMEGLDEPLSPREAGHQGTTKQQFADKLKSHSQQRQFNPLHGETKIAAKLTTHQFFEPICLVVICFNALWIGYSVDQEDPDGKDPPYYHNMMDNFFCLFFSGEIILRIASYRRPLSFVFDPANKVWNLFDFTLVVILLGETWAMPMMLGGKDKPDIPALSSMRLMRMLRMVRVLRMVPELAMMVRSLVAAIRSTGMTGILAVGIMYIWSIVLTQWARGYKQIGPCRPVPPSMPEMCIEAAFGSIAKSFLTLMQILCFDASFALIRAVLYERIPYGLFLILFILIAAFTVLNMLIGVVCQIVATTSSNERSSQRKQQVDSLFRLLEIEDTGFISRKELERNKHVLEELDKVGVDEEVLKTSLSIIDRKNASHVDDPAHIDLEEFLEVVFKLLHPPQTQDILLVQSKLEKLEKALASTGMSQAKAAEAKIKANTDQLEDENYEMDETTRMAVENSLWELESQVTSMMNHALETTGQNSKKAPFVGAGWDVELRRLDAAMCRLRVRLERCQDEAGPGAAASGGGGGAADEAVQLASAELQYWRRLCGEVVQSISAASALMAQALRESQPDGMFRGAVDFPVAAAPPPPGAGFQKFSREI